MERRIMVALLKACGAALLAFGFLVCSNPIDIVNSVKTEVKTANNKFLLVKASGPFAANDQNVSPGTTIWVQFDRALDTSSVNSQSVVIAPSAPSVPPVTWAWDFNSATRTLTITPVPLESTTPYTLTISGLRGADGSEMQEQYAVAFKTKQAPAGTMSINTGSPYTNIPAATLYFSCNLATTQIRWSTTESDLTPMPSDAHQGLWQTKLASYAYNLGADGPKTVYYQLLDGSGNTTSGYDAGAGTHPLSASVVVDTVPPTVTSFLINNGDTTVPTTAVTLYNNASDPTSPVEMHFQNGSGAWSNWEDYSATKTWTLSSAGTRKVTAEFRDKAGNVSTTKPFDAIIAGAPTLHTYMNRHGYASIGNIYAEWTVTAPDVGTDTYHLSWRSHPSGTWIQWLNVTTSTSVTFASATETILDFAVQIGNDQVGWAPTSAPYSNIVSSFSSDIVVVYNDGDPTDTSLANTIKAVLKNNPEWVFANGITGTMPSWTVALVPQSFISTKYNPYNQVWGYPVIVTPGVIKYNESGDWVHNLIATGSGLIAMGRGGAIMLDTINATWDFKEQPPVQIGYRNSKITDPDDSVYALTSGSAVWGASPLYYKIPSDRTLLNIGKNSLVRFSVPLGGKVPEGGFVFCADRINSSYINTVQQGRFIQYGFNGLAGDVGYGGDPRYMYPFWVNLVHRMGEDYYF